MKTLTAKSAAQLRWALRVALACPLAWMGYLILSNSLGTDPAKEVVLWSGSWAIKSLWLCLIIRPLKELVGSPQLLILRKTAGLYAFFYAVLHFFAYSVLLLGFDLRFLGEEIAKRPFIIVGFLALVMMTPMAVTSSKQWQKRLKKKWVKLHQLIYPISLLVLIHFIWMQRSDYTEVTFYGIILAILLGYRVAKSRQKNSR